MSAQIINLPRYGAAPDEWDQFSLLMGLTADLLPVVSNPNAEISPNSKMQDLGKTPSRYNGARKVAGFSQWTQHQATDEDVTRWSREADYGICIQTRLVRAIDVDVPDPDLAQAIAYFIEQHIGAQLPRRQRYNSGKFLLAFRMPGQFAKRVLRVEGGIIEFLAGGQQFIACGTHPSGARYEWANGLPDDFPTLTPDQFNDLWSALDAAFSVAPAAEGKASTKLEKLAGAIHADPVAAHLFEVNAVRSQDRDGKLHIVCPFEEHHTTESHDGDTSTTYWPAHTGGYVNGHFKCLHAHCEHRTDADFRDAFGFASDAIDDFEALVDQLEQHLDPASDFQDETTDAPAEPEPEKPKRFPVIAADAFANRPAPQWIVKGVLPRAELVVLFGESGSGKSFAALDLAGAITRGIAWQGRKVKQGRVVYVAAEGAGGFRNRLAAYAQHQGVDLADINLGVIASAPNLLEKADALDVARSIGRADVVIVDTFAQAMPGANENAGEDVGRALQHCKGIHRATGATVVLVHHAGKDLAKGARGWSGLRAAADAEIEISRQENIRMIKTTKQKDGEDGLSWYFDLTQVPIGMDEDDEVITSCVMNFDVSAPVKQQAGPKLNQWEVAVMAVVTEFGEAQSVGIEVKAVVSQAFDMYRAAGGEEKRAREMMNRAVGTLKKKGYFDVEDGCIDLLAGEM